jgi:hypothetical protein
MAHELDRATRAFPLASKSLQWLLLKLLQKHTNNHIGWWGYASELNARYASFKCYLKPKLYRCLGNSLSKCCHSTLDHAPVHIHPQPLQLINQHCTNNYSTYKTDKTILHIKQTRKLKITSFCYWPADISYNREFKSNNSTYLNSMMFRDKEWSTEQMDRQTHAIMKHFWRNNSHKC